MASSPSNLVSQWFCRDDGDLLNNALVGVEVQREASIVFLDDDLGGLLHCFGTHATHGGLFYEEFKREFPRLVSVRLW